MEEQVNMVNVAVIWRGNKYMVEMDSGANLKELGDELQHSENFEEDYYVENGIHSQKVGGNMSTLLENARASSVAAAYRRLVNTSANVEAFETNDETDPDDSMSVMHYGDENLDNPSQIRALGKHAYELDPDDLSDNQNKFEPDSDDLLHAMSSSEELDPDDSGASSGSGNVVEPVVMPIPDIKVQTSDVIDEPDSDDGEVQLKPWKIKLISTKVNRNDAKANEIAKAEPHSDDKLLLPLGISDMKIDEPNLDDQELPRIQDSVTGICSRLQKAIEMLLTEVNPTVATVFLQTLFKIIRCVLLLDCPQILTFPLNTVKHPGLPLSNSNRCRSSCLFRLACFS
ncbi:hypothetical protein V6N13_127987 [Hibiscus sabdariffa]